MVLLKVILLFSVITSCTVSKTVNSTELKIKEEAVPVTVKSRFFDLGGIFSQLFPSLNQGGFQGSQGGFGGNPNGMDFPTNSQIYPPVTSQGQNPERPIGQGNTWPVIDDASLYPNQRPNTTDGQQNQYPENGNNAGTQPIRNPDNGNFGGSQQTRYPDNGKLGGSQPTQYPNGGNFGGSQSTYPNDRNFGGSQPSQYPDGDFGGSQPSQYPNGGDFGGSQPSQYPNGGDFDSSQQTQYPNGGNFGGSQYPDQDSFTNQGKNNFRPGDGQAGDGTLDGIVPPQQSWNQGNPQNRPPIQDPGQADQFDNYPNDGTTAILGRPVQIPQTTVPADQIVFPSSTENPSQRQCVQDCQSTSEYSPVCGTNNVTYFNPGKFVCARNCGINVFVAKRGRCRKDTPWPPNVISRPGDSTSSF